MISTESIEAIKATYPNHRIHVDQLTNSEDGFVVKVQSYAKSYDYSLVTLFPDSKNDFGWVIPDIDYKFVIRCMACKNPLNKKLRKSIEKTVGVTDRNDPTNLERAIGFAVELFDDL